MCDDKVLRGQKVLVTGAAKGIGKGIAVRLARAGADVAVNYLADSAGAEATAEDVRDLGGQALVIQADVGKADQVQDMFDRIFREWKTLDALVNNAGISPRKPFLETTPEEWDRVIATNLTGTGLCSRAALPGMVERGYGRIVNISSVHGESTITGMAPYAASKGGIQALTRALAVEFGPRGICVNSLIVGAVITERTLKIPYTDEQKAQWKKCIPAGRWGSCDEVAQVVLFLTNPATTWVNGASIPVDGGHTSLLPHPSMWEPI